MDTGTCTIFFHNYYGRHEEWIRFFSEDRGIPFTLFYNIVENSPFNISINYNSLSSQLSASIPGASLKKIILRHSPNKGKDIGGKLVLLDACLRTRFDPGPCIFLHDKTSPYKVQSQQWRDKLFSIMEPAFIEKALSIFKKDPATGIVAASSSIINEYDFSRQSFSSNNGLILNQLQNEYNIFPKDYRYVAGTMFWCNPAPLLNFFSKHLPLEIRATLEKGNVMDDFEGTRTHSWERLLSWLIFTQGYTLKAL